LVAEPGVLSSPIHVLLGLPHVGATAAEAERFETHRLQRTVAGEDEKIGPGDFLAVLLLDRPQQAARLVEIGVVRPAVERSKALLTAPGAAAAIADAIGARAVPGHADEKRAVVPEVRRPPLLGIRHQRVQVVLHRLQVELLELLRIIEVLAHGVGQLGILVKHLQVELVRPPVAIGAPTRARVRGLRRAAVQVRERAFAAAVSVWGVHGQSSCCWLSWGRADKSGRDLIEKGTRTMTPRRAGANVVRRFREKIPPATRTKPVD